MTFWNKNQTKTGGLAKLLQLKVSTKKLSVNLDIQNNSINHQTGKMTHAELAQGSI